MWLKEEIIILSSCVVLSIDNKSISIKYTPIIGLQVHLQFDDLPTTHILVFAVHSDYLI